MKIREQFPSKYLRAVDLGGKAHTWTISGVTVEKMLDDSLKPCLNFNETDQLLVLNKTNAGKIADAYGDESNDWDGQPVTLYPTTTEYQGKEVAAIRVKIPKETAPENAPVPAVEGRPATRPAPAAAPARRPAPQQERAIPEGKERVGSTRAAPPQQYDERNPPPPSRPNYDPDLDDEIPF